MEPSIRGRDLVWVGRLTSLWRLGVLLVALLFMAPASEAQFGSGRGAQGFSRGFATFATLADFDGAQ